MWDRTIDGKALNFHLAGINNQNFLMRDEETGSWWQQVTGEAIQGPLKGRKLAPVFCDEVSFAIWRSEQPRSRFLRPDPRVEKNYVTADWESKIARLPVVTPRTGAEDFDSRALMIGLVINGNAKAYPMADLQRQRLILDTVGETPIFLVVGDDQKSVRAFSRIAAGRKREFFVKTDATPFGLIDSETGTTWDFSGRATTGPLAGQQLQRIPTLKDYWFDWRTYHPQTSVFTPGSELHE